MHGFFNETLLAFLPYHPLKSCLVQTRFLRSYWTDFREILNVDITKYVLSRDEIRFLNFDLRREIFEVKGPRHVFFLIVQTRFLSNYFTDSYEISNVARIKSMLRRDEM